MLKALRFFQDQRLSQAKKLVLDALQDAQKHFTGIEPPKEQYQVEYKELLEAFKQERGIALYYPYIGSGLGKGPFVELMDASVKLDLISGIGVHYFGHSNPGSISESFDAALSDIVMQGNLQQNVDALDLCRLFTSLSAFDHCFLTTSGAMACENALKIVFQKKHPATRVLAFDRAFAGRSLALSQITDKPTFRQGLPSTLTVDYVPFFDAQKPQESTNRTIEALKTHIRRYPGQHAVMCLELVQGEGGFWTASKEFFQAVISVLKDNQIAVWIDEIQTFARTEALFAFQYFDLQGLVDIVTIGKVTPACATLFTKDFRPKPGLLSQTFTASTSAIRASKFIVEQAMTNGFFGPTGKIASLRKAMTQELVRLHEKYRCLHGPYGLGSMVACTPFDGNEERVKIFVQKLFHNGLISFVAGTNPTRVRFLLPVGCMTQEHVTLAGQILEKTIRESQT